MDSTVAFTSQENQRILQVRKQDLILKNCFLFTTTNDDFTCLMLVRKMELLDDIRFSDADGIDDSDDAFPVISNLEWGKMLDGLGDNS